MHSLIQRPATRRAGGLLQRSHFQIAYVTTDIEQALEVLGKRYGISQWKRGEGQMPGGEGYIRTALAWCGETMYEMIQAEGPGMAFYTDRLNGKGFQIKHHHFGYFVEDETEFDALKAMLAEQGLTVAQETVIPGFMSATYVEAPDLGHYMEFVFPRSAEGAAFFKPVPVN